MYASIFVDLYTNILFAFHLKLFVY